MFAFPDSPAIGESYSPSAGITYQWDGQAWVSAGLLATASIIDRIYLTGTATWTKPAGLAYAEVEGTAAGGSGSGAAATAASTFSGGSGGSAGAWGKKLFAASDLPSSVTITVGAPGTASNGPGVAGANTTFGSLITLPGGPGGTQSANTTASAALGSWPAASGAPVGVDIGAAGAPGGQSILNTWTSNCQIGGGGLNPYGQAFPTVVTINWVGQLGSGYGVGGSAAANGASQSARLSGAGAPGFIRVREFYTQPAGVLPGIVTPWVAYTPTFTGFGTPTAVYFFSRRVGDSLEIMGKFNAGTPTVTEARVTLGYNGVNGGLTIDAAKIGATQQVLGFTAQSIAGANSVVVNGRGGEGFVFFGLQSSGNAGETAVNANTLVTAGSRLYFNASIPITGWS